MEHSSWVSKSRSGSEKIRFIIKAQGSSPYSQEPFHSVLTLSNPLNILTPYSFRFNSIVIFNFRHVLLGW
jgi:hypothetical protein